jgi:dTDP-4-amino-4,6-dideoxygalactose transaminase
VKLRALDHANDRRRKIAARYDEAFAGSSVVTPAKDELCTHVYHQYVVRFDRRDAAQAALQRAGIGTAIHYPMPVHMQPAYEGRIAIGPAGLARSEHVAKHILSLPMYPQMTQVQINRVVDAVLSSSKL